MVRMLEGLPVNRGSVLKRVLRWSLGTRAFESDFGKRVCVYLRLMAEMSSQNSSSGCRQQRVPALGPAVLIHNCPHIYPRSAIHAQIHRGPHVLTRPHGCLYM